MPERASSLLTRVVVSPVAAGDLDDDGLVAELEAIGAGEAALAGRKAAVAAERQRRRGDAVEVLARRQGSRAARKTVRSAKTLAELPATSEALARGEITPEHAEVITRAARRVGDSFDEDDVLPAAIEESADQFAATVRRRETSDDDDASRFRRQRQARRASLFEDPDDGMWVLLARFDPVVGAAIAARLGAKVDELWRAEGGARPSRDLSRPDQRLADAIEALICGTDTGGDDSGVGRSAVAATVIITADYDTVRDRLGSPRLADGTPVPVQTLARLACDAEILPAIFDGCGQPLWMGRSRRLPTRAQRLAVIARDRTCIACDTRADWCQIHHITWWSRGGRTDLDNLCLLCSRHHHLVHEDGWSVHRTGDGFELRPP